MTTSFDTAPTTTLSVLGIGLLGPGLPSWAEGAARLARPADWLQQPTAAPAPQRLPPAERRRAGLVVKLAIVAADEACAAAGLDPATLATVFSSSTADPANCHALCEALAAPQRLVSPTRFTNSVHNAPSGYWHIATHGMRPSSSLGAFDGSFGMGLMEAAAQCASTGEPVLLVVSDVPYPEPLHRLRPVTDSLAVALLLGPQPVPGASQLSLSLAGPLSPTPCDGAGLDALRLGIPTGRALPLLQALARREPADLVVEGLPGLTLRLSVRSTLSSTLASHLSPGADA